MITKVGFSARIRVIKKVNIQATIDSLAARPLSFISNSLLSWQYKIIKILINKQHQIEKYTNSHWMQIIVV